jgi:hypothetical protein
MEKAKRRRSSTSAVLFFTALTVSQSANCITSALAESADKRSQEIGQKEKAYAAALKVFEAYKLLDQSCDPKLVDLYAPEAEIESDVERKDTPTLKEKYDRAKYCALITKTFADPTMAKRSAATVYDTPTVRKESLSRETIKVEFHAYQGDTAMQVNWLLRKQSDDRWLIVKEHALTYRKSVGPAKP